LKINNEGTEMINGNAPHALYRFFATDGSLLYVGVTNNPARRFTQHGVQRDWWHEVATIRMERHESREAVLAAEKAAIAKERPRYNVKHNGGAPVTGETPERGTPGDYPVNAGEVVALAIAPNHAGEAQCPVGIVEEVSAFGVRIRLMDFGWGHFSGPVRLVPWHRIMDICIARKLTSRQAADDGLIHEREVAELDWFYDTNPLGDFQTIWIHGKEYWREQKRAGLR